MTPWDKVVSVELDMCRLEVSGKLFLEKDDTNSRIRLNLPGHAKRSSLKTDVSKK